MILICIVARDLCQRVVARLFAIVHANARKTMRKFLFAELCWSRDYLHSQQCIHKPPGRCETQSAQHSYYKQTVPFLVLSTA